MGAPTSQKRIRAAAAGPLACIGALLIGCAPAGPPRTPEPTGPPSLLVIVTSDAAGRIAPVDDAGQATAASIATIKPVVDSLRAAHRGPVMVIDAGGSLGGSRIGDALRDDPSGSDPVRRALARAGYTAAIDGPDTDGAVRMLAGPELSTVTRQDSLPAMLSMTELHSPDAGATVAIMPTEILGTPPEADLAVRRPGPGLIDVYRVPMGASGSIDHVRIAATPARADTGMLDSFRREQERAWLAAGVSPHGDLTRVRILATADLQGQLIPTVESGGAARLAAAFRAEREGFQGPSLLLDAGGALTGEPATDSATTAFLRLASYDATAASNAVMVLDAGGARVGVLRIDGNYQDMEVNSAPAALDRWVPALRGQGADFVVALMKPECDEGDTCARTIEEWLRASSARPDLVIAAATGRAERFEAAGVPVIAPGMQGRSYGVADLRLTDAARHVWVRGVYEPETFLPPDTRVSELLARQLRRSDTGGAAVLGEPLVRGAGEHTLGRLVSDAYRWAASAHVAIERSDALAADLPPGALTQDAAAATLPANEELVVLRLTGAQLRRAMEALVTERVPDVQLSGAVVHYDAAAAPGSRVLTIRLSEGRVVGEGDLFTVAVPARLAGYGPLAEAVHRASARVTTREALLDYVRGLPQPVAAPRDPRLVPAGSSQ